MSAPVRPIYVPGEAARESVRQRAQAALDAWLREWVSGHYDGPHPRLTLQACSRGEREHAYEYSDVLRTKAGCIWFRRNTADRLNFGGAVVGATLMSGAAFVDDWMRAIADQGWDERNRMLCAALLGVPETDSAAIPLPTELLAFGSGAVQVSCDAVGLHAIADRGVWRSVPPSERMRSRRSSAPRSDHDCGSMQCSAASKSICRSSWTCNAATCCACRSDSIEESHCSARMPRSHAPFWASSSNASACSSPHAGRQPLRKHHDDSE
jgi:hypothetical protein